MIKKELLILVLLICSTALSSKEINWLTDSKEAFKKAREEDKSVYVLITAPSWCHWCQKLEEDVLIDEKVIDYLNRNYIPLMVLDRVNGEPNPDLLNFVFQGYPTQLIYDSNWGKVTGFSTFNSEEFIKILNEHMGKSGIPESKIPEKYIINGKALDIVNTRFRFENEEFKIVTRDKDYFYSINNSQDKVLFIPFAGGEVLIRVLDKSNNSWGSTDKLGLGKN